MFSKRPNLQKSRRPKNPVINRVTIGLRRRLKGKIRFLLQGLKIGKRNLLSYEALRLFAWAFNREPLHLLNTY